jgi:hypothetical protein
MLKEAAVAYEMLPATGPSADPCLCGAAHPAHSGAANNGGNPKTGCRRYRRDAAYALAERAREAEARTFEQIVADWQEAEYPRPTPRAGGWGVGPSDISTCRKRIQLRERPPADLVLNPVSLASAAVGTIIHDGYLPAMAKPWMLIEHPVFIPGLDRHGRVDYHDLIAARTGDLKTMSEYAWEELGNNGVPPGHRKQVLIYARGLELDGHPSKTTEIAALRRSNGDFELFSEPYDRDAAESAIGELRALNVALDMGVELPRDRRGPSTDKVCAEYCEMRDYCWNVGAAKAAGRSPESFTLLGNTVNEAEVAWAAGTVRGWQDALNEATKEADRSKALLVGVPNGTYGEHIVNERSRKSPLYKDYHRLVQEACARGASAQEIAAIEVPKSSTTHPEVKRVRAHKLAKRKATTPKEEAP